MPKKSRNRKPSKKTTESDSPSGKPCLALIYSRFPTDHQPAVPSNAILGPERSLPMTIQPISAFSPGTIAPGRTYRLDNNLSSAATASTPEDEAKMMIGTLVLKNARLEAEIARLMEEKEQLIRDREAAGRKTEEQATGLLRERDEAVDQLRRLKGQAGRVNAATDVLRRNMVMAENSVIYLEKLLSLEERPRYSSRLRELQLE